ncbi:hypothetical protein Patl1_35665 [Pistacia atlantica]|nr:hypothetical protein Patl1_35665 [Pistacia atlantica]
MKQTMMYGPKSWRCILQGVKSLSILWEKHLNQQRLMLPMQSGMQKIKRLRAGY